MKYETSACIFFYAMLLATCAFSAWVISEIAFGGYTRIKGEDFLFGLAIILPLLWEIVAIKEINEVYYEED